MRILDEYTDLINASFSQWIKVEDNQSKWTIEDFPYSTVVDENITYPHCWKCVTVNHCWFKNEENKKPNRFDYSNTLFSQTPLSKRGLYHPHCHCKELAINNPKWWCKVEDGYIMNLLGEKKNKISFDYDS